MSSTSKTQINRLGERLKRGEVSEADLRELDAYRESFAEAYEEVVSTLRKATGLEPTGRPRKTPFAIIEKLHRESTLQLSRMQDVAGCRVVVADISEQDRVVELLTRAFGKAKIVDRRERPSHGYRAVHVIATARNKIVEIQVRTELQDLWAQQSEVMSDRTDPRIKYGGGDPDAQGLLLHNSKWIADIEKAEQELADRKARLVENMKGLNKIFEALPRRAN